MNYVDKALLALAFCIVTLTIMVLGCQYQIYKLQKKKQEDNS